MKNKYLLFVGLIFISSSVFASTLPTIETYYQHKEKTTEYIVDKDDDEDYKDDKFYFKILEKLSKKVSFTLNYIHNMRKYLEEQDINNKTHDYKATLDYFFFDDGDRSLKLDVNAGYKDKRYKDKQINDFDRFKTNAQLTYRVEGNYWIAFKGGLEQYDFITANHKDKYIYFGKINGKKYFMDEKLVLIGGAKLKNTEVNPVRDSSTDNTVASGQPVSNGVNLQGAKTETELNAGVDIKPGKKLLEKISLRGAWGERNTVEDDDWEDDEDELTYDYTYTLASARTVHPITDTLETALHGNIKDKNYKEVDNSYTSYLVGNDWSYKYYLQSKRKKYIVTKLDIFYGKTTYDTQVDSDNYKDGATIELAYKMWGKFSYGIEAGAMQYRYDYTEKDRNTYHAGVILTRKFFNNRLELNLEYNYRIKDYLDSDRRNIYQHSYQIGGVWKW